MHKAHISLRDLVTTLTANPGIPLKFYLDGFPINPGYHVTEVKYATIDSLDCGKGSHRWNEITIQLLDGSAESTQGYMSTSKFTGIVGAAMKSLVAAEAPALFFEFAPGNGPIRKLSVRTIEPGPEAVSVLLGSERVVCKPFQRSMAARAAATAGGRATAQSVPANACCADDIRPGRVACCG